MAERDYEPNAGEFLRAATSVINTSAAGLGALVAIAAVVLGLILATAVAAVSSDRIAGVTLGSPLAAVQAAMRYSGLDEEVETDSGFPATVLATWEGFHGGGLELRERGADSNASGSVAVSTFAGRFVASIAFLVCLIGLGGESLRRVRTAVPVALWAALFYTLSVLTLSWIPLGTWTSDGITLDVSSSSLDALVGTAAAIAVALLAWAVIAGRSAPPIVRAVQSATLAFVVAAAATVAVFIVASVLSAATSDYDVDSDGDSPAGLVVDLIVSSAVALPDIATNGMATSLGAPLSVNSPEINSSDSTYGLADLEHEAPPMAFWLGLLILYIAMAGSMTYAGYASVRHLPRPPGRSQPQVVAISALVATATWVLAMTAGGIATRVTVRSTSDVIGESFSAGIDPLSAIFGVGIFAVVFGAIGATMGSSMQPAPGRTVTADDRIEMKLPLRAIRLSLLCMVLGAIVTIAGTGWWNVRASGRSDLRKTERSLRGELREERVATQQESDDARGAEASVTTAANAIRNAKHVTATFPREISDLQSRRGQLSASLSNAESAAR